jgi:hypothetical protein
MSKLALVVIALVLASAAAMAPANAQTYQDCSHGGCATPANPATDSTHP